MPTTLEVIVTSAEEAIEAEAGGAHRLELVRDLASGGLTPGQNVIEAVLEAVTLPVRVMVRETATMSVASSLELDGLVRRATEISKLAVDGLVIGLVRHKNLDVTSLRTVVDATPGARFTFHRAFDELADPLAALAVLKRFEQVDRILTVGGTGDWAQRRERLIAWQRAADPALTILVGVGLCASALIGVRDTAELREVHIGRAARVPQDASGRVTRAAVRSVRNALQ